MKIFIVSLNYAPEMVGIGPYSAGMAEWLAASGHEVTVVCAKPYYPQWKVDPVYAGGGKRITNENGVRVVRVPIYVPAIPNGTRRLLHHTSFAINAHIALRAEARRAKPDIVVGIAPSLISMIAAKNIASRTGAKLWMHIQDFEVEAAFATGLLNDKGWIGAAAWKFEKWAINADKVSSISPQMCAKLQEKGICSDKIFEFRNWANVHEIKPLESPSSYVKEWGIDRRHVAIYSGNIANKQGIEIVIDAAKILQHRKDLMFVICGEGPNRVRLQNQSAGLDNIMFHNLQPRERLSDLLGMASIHLLPQISEAADLVLPSKLTNMLASGRPIVATAAPGTGLAREIEGCGIVTPPGDAAAFAEAINTLLDDHDLSRAVGASARCRALETWGQEAILSRFDVEIRSLSTSS